MENLPKNDFIFLNNFFFFFLLFFFFALFVLFCFVLFVCLFVCLFVFCFYLRPVSRVPNVASVSGSSILDCPFGFLLRLF